MQTSADSRVDRRFVVPLVLALLVVAVVALTATGERPGLRHLSQLVVWIATLATLLVVARRSAKTFRFALAAIAVLAAVSYFDYGRFHGQGRFTHDHEFYHHTVASKFSAEVGYDGFYVATLRALDELDPATGRSVELVKNLRSYRLESAAICRQRADGILARFTPERWEEFKRDVAYWQTRIPSEHWRLLLIDHGNNTSPFVTAMYAFLTVQFGLGDGTAAFLAALDLALIALMLVLVVRAFGVEAGLLFAIFFFANVFAVFDITGGSFLRHMWLAGVVAFACFAHGGRWAAAGVALAIATLDRVFPVLLGAVPLALLIAGLWRERRVPREAWRFALGFGGTLAVVGGVATAAVGGLPAWLDFYANTSAHQRGFYINQISLRSLFLVDPTTALGAANVATDESAWIRERMARHDATATSLLAVRALLAALLAALIAVERRTIVALGLLAFAPFALLYPANYYFVVLCLAVMCWAWWPRLVILIAATQVLFWTLTAAMPAPAELEFVNWIVSLVLAAVLVALLAVGLMARCRESRAFRRVVVGILVLGAIGLAGGIAVDSARVSDPAPVVDAAVADVLDTKRVIGRSESMASWGSGWSLDDQLLLLTEGVAGDATLSVRAPRDGRYRLKIDFTASPAFGMVTPSVNGSPRTGQINLYSPRVGKRPTVHDVELHEGVNSVLLTLSGKDPRATASHFGLDRIVLLEPDAPDRDLALKRALGWVRDHPADTFDGGVRAVCDEVVALAALASDESFGDADVALDELRARVAWLAARADARMASADVVALGSAARAARRHGLELAAARMDQPPPTGLAAREHAERKLLAMISGTVDFGQAPGVALTLWAIADDVLVATDHGHEPPPATGVLADHPFWAKVFERGLTWTLETRDAYTTARLVHVAHALELADEVPSLGRAVEFLLQLQEDDGSLGPVRPRSPNPRRDAVLAAIHAWSAERADRAGAQ
ncbi:MAG: hypothetical protein ACYTCU_00145 [Planctomycetota bacterium]|jgi:hypothetical protein